MERLLVTPAEARRLLYQAADGNRPIHLRKVREVMASILAGKLFVATEDRLSLRGSDGRLLDGQHRLLAVVLLDTTVEFPVEYT